MSYKFEIRGENNLVITDTTIVDAVDTIVLDMPKVDVYYRAKELKDGTIFLYDKNSVNAIASGVLTTPLANCINDLDVAFTKESFIAWVYSKKLGFKTATGGSVADKNGFVDYNDLATATTPINIISDTWTDIPNDTLGAFTNTNYLPDGVTTLINGVNGYLDFSELTLGSDVLIRIDFVINPNTNNSLLETRYILGQGAGEYSLPVRSRRLDSGSGINYSSEKGSFYIYMGDINTLGGVGKLQVRLSTNGVLINNGVAIKIYKK